MPLKFILLKNVTATYYIFRFFNTKLYSQNYYTVLSGNDSDGLFFGIMLLTVGLTTSFNSLKNLEVKRVLKNVPTSKIRSLSMGLVELKGKIQVKGKILKDPFDDKECVYWRIHIQELVKSGKTRKWVTRHKAKDQVPFLISDQTGFVLIYLDDVNMNDVKRDKQYDLATFFSDEIPPIVKDYCRKYNVKLKGWFGGKKRLRLTIKYLEPDDDIYILGNARPVLKDELKYSKNAFAVIDMSKRGLFIISDKSEKELIDENGGQSFAVPFGIILSAAGLSMVLNSLGYI
tara:strand:+ start:30 stop:893 length:864 start_codon:yes stop_codon:yes gene_type:complete